VLYLDFLIVCVVVVKDRLRDESVFLCTGVVSRERFFSERTALSDHAIGILYI